VKIIEPGPSKTDFYERSVDLIARLAVAACDGFVARVMPLMHRAGATAPGLAVVACTI
jgi:hypothetical protein